jgi:chemotaxis protein histidine kinase CheA
MPGKKQDIEQKLQLLRQQYAEKLPTRITALVQQWQAVNPDPQSAEFENLIREFHSLAGSGTSFGFPQITTLSRNIENILLGTKSTNTQLSEQVKADINAKLSILQQAASQEQDSSYEDKQ